MMLQSTHPWENHMIWFDFSIYCLSRPFTLAEKTYKGQTTVCYTSTFPLLKAAIKFDTCDLWQSWEAPPPFERAKLFVFYVTSLAHGVFSMLTFCVCVWFPFLFSKNLNQTLKLHLHKHHKCIGNQSLQQTECRYN